MKDAGVQREEQYAGSADYGVREKGNAGDHANRLMGSPVSFLYSSSRGKTDLCLERN
jgi:hypothetical protein